MSALSAIAGNARRSARKRPTSSATRSCASAALQRPARLEYVDTPPSVLAHYQYFTEARMERLRQAGYTQPFTSLEEGVADYVQRYLAKPDPYL